LLSCSIFSRLSEDGAGQTAYEIFSIKRSVQWSKFRPLCLKSLPYGGVTFIPRLHDPANVQQISSKRRAISTCILYTFAESLLEVCWTFAGSCKRSIKRPFKIAISVARPIKR